MSKKIKPEQKFIEIEMLKTRLSKFGTLRANTKVMLPYDEASKLIEEGYAKLKTTNYI